MTGWVQQHRRRWMAALLGISGAMLTAAPAPAAATAWEVDRNIDGSDPSRHICEMYTTWRDGRDLAFWVDADEFFGFSVIDPEWRLPKGVRSYVTFEFSNKRANSFEVAAVGLDEVIGDWRQDDGVEFLQRFRDLKRMTLIFPQGARWSVDLTGSKRAFQRWFDCFIDMRKALGREGGEHRGRLGQERGQERGEERGGDRGDRLSRNPF